MRFFEVSMENRCLVLPRTSCFQILLSSCNMRVAVEYYLLGCVVLLVACLACEKLFHPEGEDSKFFQSDYGVSRQKAVFCAVLNTPDLMSSDGIRKDTKIMRQMARSSPRIEKYSHPRNRPWRPLELWDVEYPTLSRQSAHRWRWGC
jgi:hypothetical protein